MSINPAVTLLMALAVSTGSAFAQAPTLYASGLSNPSRIVVGPNGSLLATEVMANPNTGRISTIDTSGNRRTLLDGLPSGKAAPDFSPDGPNGLALSGRTLYIANGEGDTHVNGPKPGQIVPNPAGPSSPLFATILQVNFSNDIDRIATGFSLQLQDHFTLIDGNPVTLTNASGDTATVSLLTVFQIDRPDPNTIVRNTHPYGLAMLASQPNTLYADDAGNNAIWKVDVTTGKRQVLTRFAPTPNPSVGPPVIEAVPTSVRAYNNHLLVTLLSGAPFIPGQSRVMEIDPATGNATLFIALLSSSIDSVYRVKANGAQQWFVLEYSLNLSGGAPGRLLEYDTPVPTILADGLKTPTALAFDGASGSLYVADQGDGSISKINVGN